MAALFLALPAGASAAVEGPDAGEVPSTARNLAGEAVGAIDGSLESSTDQDLYRICLEGGGNFSATTVGGSEVDTQLFLFDATGHGVYANDDSQASRQSTLPAGDPLTPAAPGVYLLAVSPYDRDPQSALGAIFAAGGGVVGPTGPGGGWALSGWAGRAGVAGGYRIALAGTAACAQPDETPPVVDLRTPEDGAAVPRGAAVEVDFSCSDEGGSGLVTCEGSVADGDPLDTSTLGDRAVTVTAVDGAGNRTVVTHTAHVVDAAAPTISLRTPADGAGYLLGADVTADYDCIDEEGGSGLASCEGDVPDGAPIDTASVGAKTFTVHATDAAGGSATVTASYRVLYDFRGFRWPTRERPAVNRARAGWVVPVRFSLGGRPGRDVLADGYPQVAEVECGSGEEPESGEPAALLGGVRHRRFGRSSVLLWRTRRSWAGSCRQFLLGLADGTVRRADYRFARH
jgi:hypothetical protein